jgi:trimethylamine--corrinoid protein Co-methyltransferase
MNATGYTAADPNDVPREVKPVEMVKRSLEYTDFPVIVSPYGQDRTSANLEMIGLAVGDPEPSRPYAFA